jgi:dihydrofolate reductase
MEEQLAMRRVKAFISVTLDGVYQAPARPDEDRRGGFELGGWATPYADEDSARFSGVGMSSSAADEGVLLLGRRTYEDFYEVWPKRTDGNPFTAVLNRKQKYVASNTLHEPLPWVNSTLLDGDARAAVARLKEEPGGEILILGSGGLVQSLMERDLIDEYVLLITPLVLGSGRRLFIEGSPHTALKLVDTKATRSGVIFATYQSTATSGRGSE